MGWLYHLIFPIDFWLAPTTQEDEDDRATKYAELLPIFGWLVPLTVLLSNTVSLGLLGMIVLYGIISGCLAMLSCFHLKLDAGRGLSLALNLWAGMALTAALMWLALFFLGLFTSCEFDASDFADD